MLARGFKLFCLIIILIFAACCSKERRNLISYDLTLTDFVEKIRVRGTIQATNNINIVAPDVSASNMIVKYLVEDGSHVNKGDTICILDAPDLIGWYESLVSKHEDLLAEMAKLVVDQAMNLSLLEAQLENIKAKVALNSLDSIQKQFAPPLKQKIFALELEKANIEKEKLEKKIISQKKIDEAELKSTDSRIVRSNNKIQRALDQINSLILMAPKKGIVIHNELPVFSFHSPVGAGSIGGKVQLNCSVWNRMVLLQIPDLSQMEVSIEVSEADYKRIKPGQKVFIHIEAASDLKTTGVIKKKTLVGKKTESESSVQTYEVIASIDSCHSLMKPGLSGDCNIIVNEVKGTVVVPTMSIFEHDSVKIIYVADKSNDKYKAVPVETGQSNSSESIILKGLTGNETIALIEPPRKLIMPQVKETCKTDRIKDTLSKDTVNNHMEQNHKLHE